MSINYSDKVYGKIKITEPVVLDLMNCESMKRLKGIDQVGYSKPFFHYPRRTRFEHSVGVYLLLKKYNTPIEEQVSGLIHDISHSAFSHAIDYIMKGDTKYQSYQDNIFDEYIIKTEIPKILKKYNHKLDYLLDDANFPLKENNLPNLCADRIDYVLRDAIGVGELKDASYFIDNLIVENKTWIFKNFSSAKKFAKLFQRMNTYYYSSFIVAIMYKTLGDYFIYALDKKYISLEDLYTTDEIVLRKVSKYHKKDSRLKFLSDRMNNKIKCKNNTKGYESIVYCKSRMIDPSCIYKGKIKRLSEIESKWKKVIKEENKPKKYFLKFER